jgi:hypothetical protein
VLCEPSASRFHQHLVKASVWKLALNNSKELSWYAPKEESERKVSQISPPENLQKGIFFSDVSRDCSYFMVKVNE